MYLYAMVGQVGHHGGDEQLCAGREEEHEPARRHRGPSHLDGEGETMKRVMEQEKKRVMEQQKKRGKRKRLEE